MKRFYTMVTTAENQDKNWEVHLDGRSVKTPSGHVLAMPNEDIARHIANEWSAQTDNIDPETMPLTQFVTTALDRSQTNRDEIKSQTLNYLDTDLLCYRTDQPLDIAQKQAESWDPILATFKDVYDAELETTTGLAALQQPEDLKNRIADEMDKLNLWHFTALQMTTAMTGSLVLALLFIRKKLLPDDLIAAAFVEENHKFDLYNEEKYGQDPHTKKRMKSIHSDLSALETFLSCT